MPPAFPTAPPAAPTASDAPFGANEMRLGPRAWAWSLGLVLLILLLTPRVWEKLEPFETGADYRLPYEVSKDYWLYRRWLRRAAGPGSVVLLGDSVIWGEYVLPEGTLSHGLNREAGRTNRFVNGGVNGLFPLAMEGLIRYHGQALRQRKVILHCNPLWLTSPKADLSTTKEEPFNHASLVPQFWPRVPCYRAGAQERLSAAIEREATCLAWVAHLQNAYFGQQSIPKWTLATDGEEPPRYPHTYQNPLAQITFKVPAAPGIDPQRGPQSARHRPWSEGRSPARFEWVGLNTSLQWRAFQRLIELLRARGNQVLVILGPFNEHLIAEENRPAYRQLHTEMVAWLRQSGAALIVPDALPSALYADASHPLTEGYAQLASRFYHDTAFQQWLGR